MQTRERQGLLNEAIRLLFLCVGWLLAFSQALTEIISNEKEEEMPSNEWSRSTPYGARWRVAAHAMGQHEEMGYIIETEDGIRVCSTPDFDATARVTGFARHSPENHKVYDELPHLIVKDHNDAIEREIAIKKLLGSINNGIE